MAARSWSRVEVEATVADYLDMLAAELRGEEYSKTEHRRRLIHLLENRSESAVELKHRNISAILIELGIPYLSGYKPARNYQKLLAEVVAQRVGVAHQLARLVATDVEAAPVEPHLDDILSALVPGPERDELRKRVKARPRTSHRMLPVALDYLALEARNAALGRRGEEFVLDFERARLIKVGRSGLADRVEHVSRTLGDGAGFDVRSFEESGADRLIEVKTTKYGMYTPFYVTRNELEVSQVRADAYHLYRVFDFRRTPRVFARSGPLDRVCELIPVQYEGRVA